MCGAGGPAPQQDIPVYLRCKVLYSTTMAVLMSPREMVRWPCIQRKFHGDDAELAAVHSHELLSQHGVAFHDPRSHMAVAAVVLGHEVDLEGFSPAFCTALDTSMVVLVRPLFSVVTAWPTSGAVDRLSSMSAGLA